MRSSINPFMTIKFPIEKIFKLASGFLGFNPQLREILGVGEVEEICDMSNISNLDIFQDNKDREIFLDWRFTAINSL